ncbi:MAG: hypothetical protein J0I06_07525 [Planctomycetes bacterium]|nr:hypothetical protein [Planctomycetota bacterium]
MRRLAFVAFVTLAAGCGILPKGRFPKLHPQPPTFSQYHLDGWQWSQVNRVLVLPFLNESPYTRAGDEVRAAFTSQLQREGRWEVISAAPDDRAVLAAQIHRNGRFDEAAMLVLAQLTGADVVVHGIVTHYSPYPRPRLGLILQAIGPQEAKVVASVDGLWDTTDAAVAERSYIYYRQSVHPRPAFLRNNRIPVADDDTFAGDIALLSPALIQRWVCFEAIRALQGKPVPGVVSPKSNSSAAAAAGAAAGSQSNCGP